jgi:hypothetical protein
VDTTALFQNIVYRADPQMDRFNLGPILPSDSATARKFQIVGVQLDYLYRFAYTGLPDWDYPSNPYYATMKFSPILNISDSSNFDRNKYYSFLFASNHKMARQDLMKLLQDDLAQGFGYKVRVEQRKVPYWSISLRDSSVSTSLKTKGGRPSLTEENGSIHLGFTANNLPMRSIVSMLYKYFQLHGGPGAHWPFVDETGLTENIDLTVNALLPNFDEFRSALKDNGIELTERDRLMPCIVIGDR